MGFNDNPYIRVDYNNDKDYYSKIIVDNKTVWRKPISYNKLLWIYNPAGRKVISRDAETDGGLTFSLTYKENNNWYECLPPEQNNPSRTKITTQRVIKYEDELKYTYNLSNGYELLSNNSKIIYPNHEELALEKDTPFVAYNNFDIEIRIKPILYSLTVTVREGIDSYKVYRTAGAIAQLQGVESGYITTSDKLYYGDVLTTTAELQEGYTALNITSGYNPASTITVKGDISLNINSRKIYGYFNVNKDSSVTSYQIWYNNHINLPEGSTIHYGDTLQVRKIVLVEGYYLVNFVDTYTFLPTQDGEILNINLTTSNLYNLYIKNNSEYTVSDIPAGQTSLKGTYSYGQQASVTLYCEGSWSDTKYVTIKADTTLNVNVNHIHKESMEWETDYTPAHIQEDTYKGNSSYTGGYLYYNFEAVGWSCSDYDYYGFNPISRPEGCTHARVTWNNNYYIFEIPSQLPSGEGRDSYGYDFDLLVQEVTLINRYLWFKAESTSDGDSDYYFIAVYFFVPKAEFDYATYQQKLQNLEYGRYFKVTSDEYIPYFED